MAVELKSSSSLMAIVQHYLRPTESAAYQHATPFAWPRIVHQNEHTIIRVCLSKWKMISLIGIGTEISNDSNQNAVHDLLVSVFKPF